VTGQETVSNASHAVGILKGVIGLARRQMGISPKVQDTLCRIKPSGKRMVGGQNSFYATVQNVAGDISINTSKAKQFGLIKVNFAVEGGTRLVIEEWDVATDFGQKMRVVFDKPVDFKSRTEMSDKFRETVERFRSGAP
jgi:hypothetical protein